MGHQSMGRKCMDIQRKLISKHLKNTVKKITFPSKDICKKLSIEYTSDEQCDSLQP